MYSRACNSIVAIFCFIPNSLKHSYLFVLNFIQKNTNTGSSHWTDFKFGAFGAEDEGKLVLVALAVLWSSSKFELPQTFQFLLNVTWEAIGSSVVMLVPLSCKLASQTNAKKKKKNKWEACPKSPKSIALVP